MENVRGLARKGVGHREISTYIVFILEWYGAHNDLELLNGLFQFNNAVHMDIWIIIFGRPKCAT